MDKEENTVKAWAVIFLRGVGAAKTYNEPEFVALTKEKAEEYSNNSAYYNKIVPCSVIYKKPR